MKRTAALMLALIMCCFLTASFLSGEKLYARGKAEGCTNGHQWGEWVETIPPTCTTDGQRTHTCTVCTAEESEPILAGHQWGEWVETIPPTCTTDGQRTRTCTVCTAEESEPILAGHQWGEWETITQPTCREAGKKIRKCSKCGLEQEGTITRVNHNYGANGKCIVCGLENPDWVDCNHKFSWEEGAYDWFIDADNNPHLFLKCLNNCLYDINKHGNEERKGWIEYNKVLKPLSDEGRQDAIMNGAKVEKGAVIEPVPFSIVNDEKFEKVCDLRGNNKTQRFLAIWANALTKDLDQTGFAALMEPSFKNRYELLFSALKGTSFKNKIPQDDYNTLLKKALERQDPKLTVDEVEQPEIQELCVRFGINYDELLEKVKQIESNKDVLPETTKLDFEPTPTPTPSATPTPEITPALSVQQELALSAEVNYKFNDKGNIEITEIQYGELSIDIDENTFSQIVKEGEETKIYANLEFDKVNNAAIAVKISEKKVENEENLKKKLFDGIVEERAQKQIAEKKDVNEYEGNMHIRKNKSDTTDLTNVIVKLTIHINETPLKVNRDSADADSVLLLKGADHAANVRFILSAQIGSRVCVSLNDSDGPLWWFVSDKDNAGCAVINENAEEAELMIPESGKIELQLSADYLMYSESEQLREYYINAKYVNDGTAMSLMKVSVRKAETEVGNEAHNAEPHDDTGDGSVQIATLDESVTDEGLDSDLPNVNVYILDEALFNEWNEEFVLNDVDISYTVRNKAGNMGVEADMILSDSTPIFMPTPESDIMFRTPYGKALSTEYIAIITLSYQDQKLKIYKKVEHSHEWDINMRVELDGQKIDENDERGMNDSSKITITGEAKKGEKLCVSYYVNGNEKGSQTVSVGDNGEWRTDGFKLLPDGNNMLIRIEAAYTASAGNNEKTEFNFFINTSKPSLTQENVLPIKHGDKFITIEADGEDLNEITIRNLDTEQEESYENIELPVTLSIPGGPAHLGGKIEIIVTNKLGNVSSPLAIPVIEAEMDSPVISYADASRKFSTAKSIYVSGSCFDDADVYIMANGTIINPDTPAHVNAEGRFEREVLWQDLIDQGVRFNEDQNENGTGIISVTVCAGKYDSDTIKLYAYSQESKPIPVLYDAKAIYELPDNWNNISDKTKGISVKAEAGPNTVVTLYQDGRPVDLTERVEGSGIYVYVNQRTGENDLRFNQGEILQLRVVDPYGNTAESGQHEVMKSNATALLLMAFSIFLLGLSSIGYLLVSKRSGKAR